eukprot:9479047-Pyramimonas_sp.AAC.1
MGQECFPHDAPPKEANMLQNLRVNMLVVSLSRFRCPPDASTCPQTDPVWYQQRPNEAPMCPLQALKHAPKHPDGRPNRRLG